jgi:hypothetical protein
MLKPMTVCRARMTLTATRTVCFTSGMRFLLGHPSRQLEILAQFIADSMFYMDVNLAGEELPARLI